MTGPGPSAAAVAWRDGVHLVGTPIWCDARRARDVCFVSAADAIRSPRHGQLVASSETLTLLERRDPRTKPHSQLAVPWGRPFTLGSVRLETFRSGYGVGSASLLAKIDGARVVYAGSVDLSPEGLAGPADVRSCDVLVVDGRYAEAHFAFPPRAEVIAEVRQWLAEVTASGAIAIVLVTSFLKGLDIAAALGDDGPPLVAHRAIHHAAQRLRPSLSLPRIRRWSGRPKVGSVLLWPALYRQKLAPAPLPEGSAAALVSGAALDPEAVGAAEVDRAFPWSNRSDAAELERYIDSTGATEVYLTEASDAGVECLRSASRRVQRLGPPIQLALWGRPRIG